MSRKKRVWYLGATYHVMSRGNRRIKLYKDRSDHMRFLECIESCGEKYDFKIHSICLMTNHFHMILETGNDELWKIMQREHWWLSPRTFCELLLMLLTDIIFKVKIRIIVYINRWMA